MTLFAAKLKKFKGLQCLCNFSVNTGPVRDNVNDAVINWYDTDAIGRAPGYFLPWHNDGLWKIDLNNPNVNFFFTALLGGYCMYVSHLRTNPNQVSVYHANANHMFESGKDIGAQYYMDKLFYVVKPATHDLVGRCGPELYRRFATSMRIRKAGKGHDANPSIRTFFCGVRNHNAWKFYFQTYSDLKYRIPEYIPRRSETELSWIRYKRATKANLPGYTSARNKGGDLRILEVAEIPKTVMCYLS